MWWKTMTEKEVNDMSSLSASPWSSFHSSITLSARGPGTPVRQSERTATKQDFSGTITSDLQQRFTELDLLIE